LALFRVGARFAFVGGMKIAHLRLVGIWKTQNSPVSARSNAFSYRFRDDGLLDLGSQGPDANERDDDGEQNLAR